MDLNLAGKTALVTGSTKGIGKKIAETLAKMGATVYVNGRSADTVQQVVEDLKALVPNSKIIALPADIGVADGTDKVISYLPQVDILVNNTGIFEPKGFFDITDDEWQKFYDVNVMSGIRLSRHFLKGMLERNRGRIIFISSESGVQIPPEMIHYGMTKTAQLAISRGLAELTKGTNVTVNSVLPGPTDTAGVRVFMELLGKAAGKAYNEREFVQSIRPSSLIDRLLTEQEVANAVAYLASPASSGTNGSSMRVEGGLLRQIP